MLLKKITRLVGFIIGAPFVLFLLFEVIKIFPFDFADSVFNIFEFLEMLCVIIFILGYFISLKNEIMGGFMAFLTPIAFMALESIDAGAMRLTSSAIIMVVAGAFLLFTAEKEH
ncbi:MAG: hypothetical protein K8R40_12770 [Anaerolineaceae bacterium]|nr:hypothetical protein [Anaerolineaceae bacterium]